MFDELPDSEDRGELAHNPSEEQDKPARNLSRWSHVIAGLVFCLIYFPLRHHPWSWLVAVAVSYTVFTFAIALGLSLDDADDFFGDPRAVKSAAAMLLPHAPMLALIMLGGYGWLHIKPALPLWATAGRKLPPWDVLGIVVVWFAGTREGIWMASQIKRRLGRADN
jgi:Na+/proline symporter